MNMGTIVKEKGRIEKENCRSTSVRNLSVVDLNSFTMTHT